MTGETVIYMYVLNIMYIISNTDDRYAQPATRNGIVMGLVVLNITLCSLIEHDD